MDDTTFTPGEFTTSLPDASSTLTSIRARLGDAPSQAALGLLCTRERRYEEALEWLDKAASTLPVASVMYYNATILSGAQGLGYQQRAVAHLRAAANANCWEALQVLASLHVHGEGVPKDLSEASRLIERSRAIRGKNDA
jgi:TPR repeat protein